jgi:hypothetical protein
MSIVLNSSGGGSVTINEPSTASNFTHTLPAGTGSVVVSGINSAITAGTAVASTSGTSIDFTSIPSWVKRVTVMMNGVSTSGTSNLLIQTGAGSVTSSGYVSSGLSFSTGAAGTGTTSTAGFVLTDTIVAARAYTIIATLVLQTGNTWLLSSTGIANTFAQTSSSAGLIALSGTLDRVRITTVNGTDTFDAGSINILYE